MLKYGVKDFAKDTAIYAGTSSQGPKGYANSYIRYKWGYADNAPSFKDIFVVQTDRAKDGKDGNIK